LLDRKGAEGGRFVCAFHRKALGTGAVGVLGALLLGVGMCLSMVVGNMVPGILVGLLGILLLLCLIPLVRGIR